MQHSTAGQIGLSYGSANVCIIIAGSGLFVKPSY
jgi:hypothetical protein